MIQVFGASLLGPIKEFFEHYALCVFQPLRGRAERPGHVKYAGSMDTEFGILRALRRAASLLFWPFGPGARDLTCGVRIE